MKWIAYGPDAWLLQFAERVGDEAFRRGRAITAELDRRPPPELLEYVPAFNTVLLEFRAGAGASVDRKALAARLQKAMTARLPHQPPHCLPVIYDGPDLERVAQQNGLTVAQVKARHAAVVYKVYAIGFAPGFPYLGDLDPRLHTPRLPSPRPHVPAGSVAIGGEHTGIYSVDTPGGWNIIGRTSTKLFVPGNERLAGRAVFLLQPGDRVKFVPQTGAERGHD
ncbi:MAG TPA: 5-oxoprolinase subunit PxpB [Candidatus Saccharimonadales bacterium]|nr:5-oxoprolinase subunit PxpB [Candidatus Saccharimonadales bacterium]